MPEQPGAETEAGLLHAAEAGRKSGALRRKAQAFYKKYRKLLGLLLLLLIGGLLLSAWVSRKISPLEQALTEAAGEAVTGDFSRAVRLSEAPSFGQPIQYYDGRSKGSEAYNALAKELLAQNKKR